jgi:hypothetical protein
MLFRPCAEARQWAARVRTIEINGHGTPAAASKGAVGDFMTVAALLRVQV